MKFRLVAVAALAACSFGAQASLTTLPSGWPPAGSTGLQNVLFNQQTAANGAWIAMGAHAYKNSAYLPNNGVDTFYADSGLYAPDGKNYANWSFDFAYDLGSCTDCHVFLGIDNDPTAGVNLLETEITAAGSSYAESWNMQMSFLAPIGFDPFSASSTGFQLLLTDAAGVQLATSAITVNVPEPGSLALAGLALAGLGLVRRRKA